jgi:hypothetical protein
VDYIERGLPFTRNVSGSRTITECQKLGVLGCSSTNIDQTAIWRMRAKRTSRTPRSMNISYCDVNKRKIFNWRQRSEFVSMKHDSMQHLANKLQRDVLFRL